MAVRDRGRLPCVSESLRRNEPIIGTASRARRWLVVEQPGPWGRDALTESQLDHTVAQTLRSHSRRHGVRVVFMRRPRWQTSAHRRVYLVHTHPVFAWIEQVDFDDPTELSRLDLSVLAGRARPGLGEAGPPSVHLVCTNGKHDPCCADFGRPVVRALEAAGVPEVWESSHIGGDRFAANIVCLPTGVYFGRVSPEGAPKLLEDFTKGLIDLDRYRGRSCFPPLVQAAETFARRELDEPSLDGVRLVSSAAEGADALTAVFAHQDRNLEVEVRREPGEPEHLTCGDHGRSAPWRYLLVQTRVAPGTSP